MKNLIFGYGVTGKSVEQFLIKNNVEYLIFDDIRENLKEVEPSKIYTEKNIDEINKVIISPGISPENLMLLNFQSKNITVETDIDIFSSYYKGQIIGVTGTNGKTTFVNELSKFLNVNDMKTISAGNVGISPLEILQNSYDYVILELSSYQIHHTQNLMLDIAVILNIYPDHIDWHNSFEEYANSKIKLLTFLSKTKSERKVIGSNIFKINSNLPAISNLGTSADIKIHRELLIALGETVNLIGGKSLYDKFSEYVNNNKFEYPHRMEQFFKLPNRNVTFINDSKATNYHAVAEATKLFKDDGIDGVLILHGITKETLDNKLSIDPVFSNIIIPKSMDVNIESHEATITYINDINELEAKLQPMITKNQVILFSCGGSSFNDFKNYEERGNFFKNLITNMKLNDA